MARTKSTESKSPDHAEASPPSKKYEPTPTERVILDKYRERTKQQPVPELKVTHGDGVVKIGVDHPHNETGTVMMMDAIGTTNHSLFKGLVAQLAGLGTSKSLEEMELKEIELNFAVGRGAGRQTERRDRGAARHSNGEHSHCHDEGRSALGEM
jgi:hypothetical protein